MGTVDEIGYRLPRNTIPLEQIQEEEISARSYGDEMSDSEQWVLEGASSRKNISSVFQLNPKERK